MRQKSSTWQEERNKKRRKKPNQLIEKQTANAARKPRVDHLRFASIFKGRHRKPARQCSCFVTIWIVLKHQLNVAASIMYIRF